MAAKFEIIQAFHGFHYLRPQWVQMDIAHQLQEVSVFLAEDGFVAVLKKMSVASVSAIETTGISCQQPAHHTGNRDISSTEQQMEVVGQQGPCVAWRLGFGQDHAQTPYEVVSVQVFPKNHLPLYSAADDVMQCSGGIDARFSWHEIRIS